MEDLDSENGTRLQRAGDMVSYEMKIGLDERLTEAENIYKEFANKN